MLVSDDGRRGPAGQDMLRNVVYGKEVEVPCEKLKAEEAEALESKYRRDLPNLNERLIGAAEGRAGRSRLIRQWALSFGRASAGLRNRFKKVSSL
jgi:hypothetical protein